MSRKKSSTLEDTVKFYMLVFAGFCMVAAVIGNVIKESGNSTTKDAKIDAWIAAKSAVERNLKNPGSADFGWTQDPQVQCKETGYGHKVSGWVEATNSFGGTVRNNWECQVNRSGEVSNLVIY